MNPKNFNAFTLASVFAALVKPSAVELEARKTLYEVPVSHGSPAKPGKHRLSGTTSPRRHSTTNWKGAKNLKELRRVERSRMTRAERKAAAIQSRQSQGLL